MVLARIMDLVSEFTVIFKCAMRFVMSAAPSQATPAASKKKKAKKGPKGGGGGSNVFDQFSQKQVREA